MCVISPRHMTLLIVINVMRMNLLISLLYIAMHNFFSVITHLLISQRSIVLATIRNIIIIILFYFPSNWPVSLYNERVHWLDTT